MNAVIYARYSSSAQTEQSIEGQLRVCREYADNKKITIINEYIDRALSGTNDNRPAFLQMIKDAEKKQFQYVICYKIDRFSRNHYDSVFYKHKLQQSGVKVLSAMEAISDTQEGKLIEGILEIMAEMYSADLSQKVKRGMKESAIKGHFTGGQILFGYKVVNKKIEIDEEKAQIVKFIFQQYVDGKTRKQIINELNALGYRTAAGKKFEYHNFQQTLKNRKYIGVNMYNGEEYSHTYPAIIDKDTFDKAQERLNERAHKPARAKAKQEYLLSGKAYCGYCGTQLVGTSATSCTGEKYCYYACSQRYKLHKCNKKNEKKNELEDFVINRTLSRVLNPECAEKIAKMTAKVYTQELNISKINEYERRIQKIDKELDNCANLMITANSVELIKRFDERAKDLTIQKNDLMLELNKLKLAVSIKHSEADILEWIHYFANGDKNDIDFRRRLINLFVNAIFIYNDKRLIFYNLTDESPVAYEEMLALIEKASDINGESAKPDSSYFKSFAPPQIGA